ncbi:MAG: prepilin-type N-terminal cleavage/methylation domain-containing protein [Pseudomonadota bacterium]
MRVQKNSGFTLLEVVLVLVIAGIIGVVVASRFVGVDTNMVVQTDVVKTHLRYAQIRAMSSNEIWGINFQGTTYSLFKNGNTADTVYFPGEESLTIDLPSGKSASEIVSFDSWGKPYNDASGQSNHPGGAIGDLSIIITANTGFIQ